MKDFPKNLKIFSINLVTKNELEVNNCQRLLIWQHFLYKFNLVDDLFF